MRAQHAFPIPADTCHHRTDGDPCTACIASSATMLLAARKPATMKRQHERHSGISNQSVASGRCGECEARFGLTHRPQCPLAIYEHFSDKGTDNSWERKRLRVDRRLA